MNEIKDYNGNILYKGDTNTVDKIRNLFIESQITLDEEGNLGKYNIDQLLKDCVDEILLG